MGIPGSRTRKRGTERWKEKREKDRKIEREGGKKIEKGFSLTSFTGGLLSPIVPLQNLVTVLST